MNKEQTDISSIKDHCTKIRNAILLIKGRSALFSDFPKGCCRDASIVAGLYLKEKGFSDIMFCSKDFAYELSSHAWIEYCGFIIDLTADQFGSEFPGVLIMAINKASMHHQKEKQEICEFAIAGMDAIELLADYHLIKNSIAKD